MHVPVDVTAGQEALQESMLGLLSRYVRLAIDNAPRNGSSGSSRSARTSSGSSGSISGSSSNIARSNIARSHFQMLAGVCAEYCVVMHRQDVLFGEVLARFKDAVSALRLAVGFAHVQSVCDDG